VGSMEPVDFLFPGIVVAVLVGWRLGKYVRPQDSHWYGSSNDTNRDAGDDSSDGGGD
jgi:hypothetical protein